MRILVTVDPTIPVPPLKYGGVERMAAGVIDWMLRHGHSVGLVAHPESTQPCERLWGWPAPEPVTVWDHLRNVWTLQQSIRQFEPDVVHSFSRLLYLGPALGQRSLPKVMSYGREPTPRTVRLASQLAGPSLRYTGCSEYIAGRGAATAGVWDAIPNFVHPERLPYVAAVAADAPLVFLSRVDSQKGAHRAIAIARGARRRLIIAGNVAETGPEAAYFRDRVAPQIDGDAVQFIGPVDDVQKAALLGSAAAMVVPIEWNEPFGIVFIEALACGTPVISCPRGALPEIVTPGVHGFLVGSDEEGIAAVAKVAGLSRAACRQRVESAFTCDVVAKQYEDLYARMLDH